MRNPILALLLMVSVPIAPAICDGSTRAPEASPPPCHAHPATSADVPAPDDDGQCCAACDAYVSGKISFDGPPQLALLALPAKPEQRGPSWTGLARQAHPPPAASSSPFLRQNSPLRI